ncbi:MAG: glycosyltransferase family 2 protein [Tidjanibacter sp.]|nr:glycosyltransferase family 2 protein [Tidjanibacter sp.]
MKTSLIISTYNRPDALAVTLESILQLNRLPDEVIIGDDGSTSETADVIASFQTRFPVPLIHIWHEDKGFRLAKIRNKCLARATGDYIIQIDGDLILHPDFITDHIRAARPGAFIKGTRVRLNKRATEQICATQIPPRRKITFLSNAIEDKRECTIRCIPLSKILAPRFKRNVISGLGCNMSFWREDAIRINGYDEHYEGWGGEDDDLALRLHRAGCRKLALRFAGIIYHLWHNERQQQKQTQQANLDYCRAQTEQGVIRCEHGMDQYL